MQQVDADLFVTEADDCFENHKKRITFPDTIEIGKVYDARRFDGIQRGFRNFFCSHLLTYRTSLLKQIGLKLQAGISYTDNEYVYFPLAAIQTMVFFRLPVYQYFIGREGQTTDPRVIMKSGTQLYQVWKRLIDDYKAGCRALPEAVLNNKYSAYEIFGDDIIKFRSSILLFDSVSDIPVFRQIKNKYRWQ